MPEVPHKFQAFLSRLKGVQERKPGLSWAACCPAHEDGKPSLSISIGVKGNLVISCHSPHGCSTAEIVKAVGLTMSDLFASDKPGFERVAYKRRPKPDVVYPYQYEDGTLAYETLRFNNPKDFSQRRPNPKWTPGGTEPRYLWSLEGVRLVLYRLPQLRAALAETPDRWIALTEGEKCAESLESLGIVATTHPLGSDHWRSEYAEPLRGRRVAIFYDLDPWQPRTRKRPGQAWAVQAARDLHAVGCQVRIVRPPQCEEDSKDDVADYIVREIKAGTPAEKIKRELFNAIQNATDYFPGWERLTGYEALQAAHRRELAKPGEMDMIDAMAHVQRRLKAAVEGVRLDSLPGDLAEAAAWCQWLAELVSPKLARVNIELGEPATKVVESTPAQISEPGESPHATQETAHPENANEAVGVQGQAEEPEPI